MKSLKKKRRVQVLVLTAVALIAAFVAFYVAIGDGVQFFRSPTQVTTEPPRPGETFRIGGLVADGSLVRGDSTTVSFGVTDGNATVPVRFTGVLPDLFKEGQGMIGTGTMEGDTFVAREILAKHDESYMPKEVIDALKEQGVYQDPNS
jgi:cytochrome c-type biogenesis protein CcmE